MTDPIADIAVALSLMREALTLLGDPPNTDVAMHLRNAIAEAERDAPHQSDDTGNGGMFDAEGPL